VTFDRDQGAGELVTLLEELEAPGGARGAGSEKAAICGKCVSAWSPATV